MTAIAAAVPADITAMIKARVHSSLHYRNAEPAIGQVWSLKESILQDTITGEKVSPVVFLCEESDLYEGAYWSFLVLPNSREPVTERPLKPWQIYPYYPLQLEHPDVIADPIAGHVVYSHPITVSKELLGRCLADFGATVANKISGKVFHWLSTESPSLILDDYNNQCVGGVTLDEMQMAHILKMFG